MNFKREFRGYDREQVDAYIDKLNETHAGDSAKQQERIFQLRDQLEKQERELEGYRAQSSMVTKALETAVAKADEVERLSKLKYRHEMEQLRIFHDKWLSYYKKLLAKYPLNEELQSVSAFNRSMSEVLKDNDGTVLPEEQLAMEQARLEKNKRRIGYINVSAPESDMSDDEIMKEILPDLPEGDDFDPEARVREYLKKAGAKESAAKKERPKKKPKPIKNNAPVDYGDRSESGFSFLEAQNPTDDLEDIMRDLGLFDE